MAWQLGIAGVSMICVGAFDWFYHALLHEVSEEHEHHEHHEGHEDNEGDMLKAGPEEMFSDYAAGQMRKYSHIFEGSCTLLAALVKAFGAHCCGPKHFKRLKAFSNAIQAFGIFGTVTAAVADFGHGHTIHGACHTGQAVSTLVMTIPNIMGCKSNCSSTASSDTQGASLNKSKKQKHKHKKSKRKKQKQKQKKCKQILTIAGNVTDTVFSIILSLLLRSPFYALEGGANINMAVENIRYYRKSNTLHRIENPDQFSEKPFMTTKISTEDENETTLVKSVLSSTEEQMLFEELSDTLNKLKTESTTQEERCDLVNYALNQIKLKLGPIKVEIEKKDS